MVKKLFSGSQLPVFAGIALVLGLFTILSVSQQRQETRSRAAGTGGSGNCTTLNTSTDELVADDCTIPGGLNVGIRGNRNTIQGGLGGSPGNIFGNDNLIMGGMNGTITGNGNEICGGLNGSINGNNNIIHGPVGGAINGTGNQINFSGFCGIIRVTPTPTRTPTPSNGTCADGIDNNENELIDSGDPICHTDGNQDNPNSYDPTRNEGPLTPTITVTTPPTVPPTLPPSVGPTVTTGPTITVAPGNTSIKLTLLLHGLGKGGDSANPQSGGNPNPLHPQRTATVQIFNSTNQLVLTKEGPINFNSTAGNFTGNVDLGSTLATGAYTVKVKTPQYLRTLVPGIQNLRTGTSNQLPVAILVNGDINHDNTLNILDYNILMGCYSDFLPAPSCTADNKLLSDLDDDGDVNQFDYNLFLRELANRQGQ